MLIFFQKSNFKNKKIDNHFPVKGIPINHHEASNKKEYIQILCFAMVKAHHCPESSPWCQKTTVYQKKRTHTASANTEVNRNRK